LPVKIFPLPEDFPGPGGCAVLNDLGTQWVATSITAGVLPWI